MFEVAGQAVLVTGAANGIGYAIARAMAAGGAHVTLCDIDGDAIEAAVSSVKNAHPNADVRGIRCDVREPEALDVVIGEIAAREGGIDTVFANAGVSAGPGFMASPDGTLEGANRARWEETLKINLTGTYDTIAAAARRMKQARRGSIVVTSSISALRVSPVSAYAYIAAKGALNAIVVQAAAELAPHNVRINAIAPGFIRSNLAGGKLRNDPGLLTTLAAKVPMGRVGDPEDIQGLAVFLASPASGYITGTVIPVDGGATL